MKPPERALPTMQTSGRMLVVFEGEEAAGAAEAGLDLVADEENVTLVTQGAEFCEIAWRRNDDAGLALDGFDQNGDGLGG